MTELLADYDPAPADTKERVLDVGPPPWCWSRLSSTVEATLSFTLPGRRINLPVPYSVQDQQILIGLATINTTGWRAAGNAATLTITGTDPHDLHWQVRASGRAASVTTTEHASRPAISSPQPRPPFDPPPNQLILTWVTVRGYYETRAADAVLSGAGP